MSNICINRKDVEHLITGIKEDIEQCYYCSACEDGGDISECHHPIKSTIVTICVDGKFVDMTVNPGHADTLLVEEYNLMFCGPNEWDVCSVKFILKPALSALGIAYEHSQY